MFLKKIRYGYKNEESEMFTKNSPKRKMKGKQRK